MNRIPVAVAVALGAIILAGCSPQSGPSPSPSTSVDTSTTGGSVVPIGSQMVVESSGTSWGVTVTGVIEVPQNELYIQEGMRCFAVLGEVTVLDLPDGQEISDWLDMPFVSVIVDGERADELGICDTYTLSDAGWENYLDAALAEGESMMFFTDVATLGLGDPTAVVFGESGTSTPIGPLLDAIPAP